MAVLTKQMIKNVNVSINDDLTAPLDEQETAVGTIYKSLFSYQIENVP